LTGSKLEVTGNQNVPKYTLWKIDADATSDDAEKKQKKQKKEDGAKSRVQFNALYESSSPDDAKGKAGSVSLSSLDWSFSEPVEFGTAPDDGIQFVMTGKGKGLHVEFHNTIGGSGKCVSNTSASSSDDSQQVKSESDCPPAFNLKFDVVVKEYQWQSAASKALVLDWSTEKGEESDLAFESEDEAGWYNPQDSAEAPTMVTVSQVDEDKKKSSLVYPRGPDGYTLIHDPQIGIDAHWPLWGVLLVAALGCVCLTVVAVGGFFLVRKKRSH
jgi:hypothetical protein